MAVASELHRTPVHNPWTEEGITRELIDPASMPAPKPGTVNNPIDVDDDGEETILSTSDNSDAHYRRWDAANDIMASVISCKAEAIGLTADQQNDLIDEVLTVTTGLQCNQVKEHALGNYLMWYETGATKMELL